jgi:hypothetical protein
MTIVSVINDSQCESSDRLKSVFFSPHASI